VALRRRVDRSTLREAAALTVPPFPPRGVSTEVSPSDAMNAKRRLDRYFEVGASGLACVLDAAQAAGLQEVNALLDLPSGHGRVLRYLRAAFPRARIVACDLDPDAVEFCASAFGAEPVVSDEDVSRIAVGSGFDVVWCGSLLTHLDEARWTPLLERLAASLAPGGVLVFSTHGRRAAERLADGDPTYALPGEEADAILDDYARAGFGYRDYPGASQYGFSLSSLPWVLERALALPECRVVLCRERAWDDHHDVVAVARL
jgi:SAM-dependent methyltransferase